MDTFEKAPPIPTPRPTGGAFGTFPPAPVPGTTGPRTASFNPIRALGGGMGNPTLAALMKRQQELAASREGQIQPIQSWTQGASHVLDKFLSGLERGTVNRQMD